VSERSRFSSFCFLADLGVFAGEVEFDLVEFVNGLIEDANDSRPIGNSETSGCRRAGRLEEAIELGVRGPSEDDVSDRFVRLVDGVGMSIGTASGGERGDMNDSISSSGVSSTSSSQKDRTCLPSRAARALNRFNRLTDVRADAAEAMVTRESFFCNPGRDGAALDVDPKNKGAERGGVGKSKRASATSSSSSSSHVEKSDWGMECVGNGFAEGRKEEKRLL
jgi:hypothetical protein